MLGIWFQRSEGAKFWLAVLTEVRQRGLQDVLICCVDGLTGFAEAIEAVYPQTWMQTCLVHQVRASLRFVPYRDRTDPQDHKIRGSFPSQDSARKLLYLAITRAQRKWRHAYNWSSGPDRVPHPLRRPAARHEQSDYHTFTPQESLLH